MVKHQIFNLVNLKIRFLIMLLAIFHFKLNSVKYSKMYYRGRGGEKNKLPKSSRLIYVWIDLTNIVFVYTWYIRVYIIVIYISIHLYILFIYSRNHNMLPYLFYRFCTYWCNLYSLYESPNF